MSGGGQALLWALSFALVVMLALFLVACSGNTHSPPEIPSLTGTNATQPIDKEVGLAGPGSGGDGGGGDPLGGRDWPEPGEDAHPLEIQYLWDHSQDEISEWGPVLWQLTVPDPGGGGGTTTVKRLSSSDPFTATYQLEDGTILVTNEDLSQGIPDPENEIEPPTFIWAGPEGFDVEVYEGEMMVYFKDTTTQQQIEQFILDHNLQVIMSWFEPPDEGQLGNALAWFHFEYDQEEFPTFDDAYGFFSTNDLIDPAYPCIKGEWIAPYYETTNPNDSYYQVGLARYVNVLGLDAHPRQGIGPPNGGWFSNIDVAVIDDGVQRWHQDFTFYHYGRLYSKVSWVGVDCYRRSYWVGRCRGSPRGSSDVHGTLVSGLISSVTNNSLGIPSLSPRSCIVPFRLKFYTNGTFNMDCLTKAIRALRFHFGVGFWGDYIRVVNMSLAGKRYPYWLTPGWALKKNLRRDLWRNDRLYVASAGNRGKNPVPSRQYPAAFDNVLGVTGLLTDSNGSQWCASYTLWNGKAHGSNYYPDNYQTYPVSGIYDFMDWGNRRINPVGMSLCGTSDYQHMNGTSAAAPQVSGLARSLYHVRPWLTYHDIWNRIVWTRDDSKARGYIAGLVDYNEALDGW